MGSKPKSAAATCLYRSLVGAEVFLRLEDGDHVGEQRLGADDALRVVRKHDRDIHAENALPHHHVAHGGVHILPVKWMSSIPKHRKSSHSLIGPTSLHHVPIGVLHGLGTLASHLTRDSDLGTLGTGLHDESKNSVAGSSHRKASQELVLEGLGLSLRAESSASDLLGKDLEGSVGEVESLLDDGGELSDALTLLTQHILRASGFNDDLGADGSYAHFNAGIPILSELTGKELQSRRR